METLVCGLLVILVAIATYFVYQYNKPCQELDVTIDYGESFSTMLYSGKFDWRDSRITPENFPIPKDLLDKKVDRRLRFFEADPDTTIEEAQKIVEKNGYELANIFELEALSKNCPKIQKRFPVIALGSFVKIGSCEPFYACINRHKIQKSLVLTNINLPISGNCRFLGAKDI